ncbi:MAG: DUF1236 domain-containing protein [Pseudolabrys sp.]|nr:DUF1236 domain-containing protein [Pseudolabrys sp.]
MAQGAEHKGAETTGQSPKESAPKEPSGAMSPGGASKAEGGKTGAEPSGKAEVEKTSPTANPSSAQTKPNEKSPSTAQSKPDEKSPSTAQAKPGEKPSTSTSQSTTSPASSTSTSQSTTSPSTTTGQGAAGARGAANLTTQQRTQITTVIREKVHAQPVTNVNFSISVGTRVPRTLHYYPLPEEVVTIYPAWRGYDFILVGNEILVIDPNTFEIVAILEA